MKKVIKIKIILSLILGSIFISSSLFDYYSIDENIKEYKIVYNLDAYSNNWQYKSVENFKSYNLFMAIGFIIYFLMNIILLSTKNWKLLYCILVIDLIMIIFIIYDLYKWMKIGFDH